MRLEAERSQVRTQPAAPLINSAQWFIIKSVIKDSFCHWLWYRPGHDISLGSFLLYEKTRVYIYCAPVVVLLYIISSFNHPKCPDFYPPLIEPKMLEWCKKYISNQWTVDLTALWHWPALLFHSILQCKYAHNPARTRTYPTPFLFFSLEPSLIHNSCINRLDTGVFVKICLSLKTGDK